MEVQEGLCICVVGYWGCWYDVLETEVRKQLMEASSLLPLCVSRDQIQVTGLGRWFQLSYMVSTFLLLKVLLLDIC